MVITERRKEKSLLMYLNDKGQVQYTVDLKDRKFFNAVSKKALKMVPTAVKYYKGNVLDWAISTNRNNDTIISVSEKLDALNKSYVNFHLDEESCKLLDGNWKMAVKAINACENAVDLGKICFNIKFNEYFNKISDYADRMSEKEKVVFISLVDKYSKENWWKESYYSVLAYWLVHHVYDFYCREEFYTVDENTENLPFGPMTISITPFRMYKYGFQDDVEAMLKVANDLNVDLRKTDYFKMRYQLNEMYKQEKILACSNQGSMFKEIQSSIADKVKFSYHGYTVVLPLEIADLKQESIAQSNCVYSIHTDYVLNRIEYIVFVRSETEPEKSLITCSIAPDGSISGYLGKGNNYVKDKTLQVFKEKFQEHLKENWG